MKQKIETTRNKRTGRIVAFAAVIGLGLSAMFASTASAIMIDTDPVIEVDGHCNLFGGESPSGIWISITNNDSWDEDYVIGVFEGTYEDGDMPTEIVELTVESGETEEGPIFIDTVVATVQVIDLSEYDMGLVYDEVVLVCFPSIPDFDFDEDEDDSDDGPDFSFDPDLVVEIPDFDELADILPDFDFGEDEDDSDEDDGVEEVDEGGEPVIVEDGSDEDDGAEAIDEGDELIICLECEDDEVEEVDEGDAPVIVEGDSDEDEKVDEVDAPVIVEDEDDVEVADEGYHAELALLAPAGDDEGEEADEDGTPVSVWENTTNNNSLDTDEGDGIGIPPKPEINPEDTDEGDGIGIPPKPEINPEDTDDTDEAASSEGKETQGSSGLSLLWIILIIVAGLVTVGTATRKIQKNNS
jgi:hypothetical protein